MTAQNPDGLAVGEREQLVHALDTRFAPHREAAAAAVRGAERDLAEAHERLERAEQAAAGVPYRSDARVFMRESVKEEVEALARKTAPKKARASYRFLLDRAVELAAAEVQGYADDQTHARDERENGVETCRAAVERATAALTEARGTVAQVQSAEDAAREGLRLLVKTLSAE